MELRYQTEDEFYARLRREYMSADGENGDKILRFVLRGAADGSLTKKHLVDGKYGLSDDDWAALSSAAESAAARAEAVREQAQYELQAIAAADTQRKATSSRVQLKDDAIEDRI